MKLLTIVLFSFASLQAQASFYQVYCSNAEGTVQTTNGHIQNTLTVTKRVWGDQGSVDTQIDLSNDENVEYNFSETNSLVNENKGGCEENPEANFVSWTRVETQKIVISRTDGKAFDADILGLTENNTIEAYLICQEEGNSQVICQ